MYLRLNRAKDYCNHVYTLKFRLVWALIVLSDLFFAEPQVWMDATTLSNPSAIRFDKLYPHRVKILDSGITGISLLQRHAISNSAIRHTVYE